MKNSPYFMASLESQKPANIIEPFPAPKKRSVIDPFPAPKGYPIADQLASLKSTVRYNMPMNQAKVKSVLSGDTLILTSIANSNSERTLSLAYCTSPHLRKDGDELCAYESRDALRQMVVGKVIQFTVLYTIPNTKRDYGIVFLQDGTRLPEAMMKLGWLRLRDDAGRKEDSEEAQSQIDHLRALEAQARSEDLGIFRDNVKPISVQYELKSPETFLSTWKGKCIDGLVERVLSGDRLLLRLLVSPVEHLQVITLIAGIRAPTTEHLNPSNGQTQAAEEYGNEAKSFVEERLLQRNIKVDILGLSPQKQLVATLRHPRGSIAKFLLEAGLARCTDFHSTLLGTEMALLREAEKLAQSEKRKIHKDHVAKAANPAGNIEAQVTRIFSADVIFVRNRLGAEKRVNLSSIRGPRTTDPAESPYREEAKEFLRKRIIGKNIRMSIDGSRPATAEYEAKEVASVTINDKNINLIMVQEGWCSVIRHRRDDTDRAPNYDELLVAQEKAKEEKRGMWSGKPAKAKQYMDASETVQKAKLQIAGLQRQKKIPAIIDFVKSGSRFIVLIPREGIKLNFVLGGIKAPKSARNPTESSEPFGQEAHDLASKRLTQRDVEINVHGLDRVGGFIGEVFVNKESFAKILVEEGFATVLEYSAEQLGNSSELLAAQQRAKEARKGLWVDWDPSIDRNENETAPHTNGTEPTTSREKDYRDIMVTHIGESGSLKIQIIGTGTSALETLMSQFKSFHQNPANSTSLPGPPKAGDYVAAKFSQDGQWYRARIIANDRAAKQAEVLYIDYGNSEKLPWSTLRPLSQAQFSPQKLRPQAQDAILSLIQFPSNKDYLFDAVQYLTELTEGKQLVANVDNIAPNGSFYITLFDPSYSEKLTDSINSEIISAGHAMVPNNLKAWERSFGNVLKIMKGKEEEAIQSRRGLWEYGDLRDD
ncbi:transcription factor [Blumeria hordei DH14]|uniref:Probable endonuclease LCL3 n=1 Tax=Blumeria graminis f. sp. hordei (strain DH14) TaxID=546991 RepID=N1JF27_BLUG1|nr:transcription factor [Blumeria hordei DH14]